MTSYCMSSKIRLKKKIIRTVLTSSFYFWLACLHCVFQISRVSGVCISKVQGLNRYIDVKHLIERPIKPHVNRPTATSRLIIRIRMLVMHSSELLANVWLPRCLINMVAVHHSRDYDEQVLLFKLLVCSHYFKTKPQVTELSSQTSF